MSRLDDLLKEREKSRENSALSSRSKSGRSLDELLAEREYKKFSNAYNSGYEALQGAYGGWNTKEAMEGYRNKLTEANQAMSDYLNTYNVDDNIREAYNNFSKAYEGFDQTAKAYSAYKNADAFNKAKKNAELTKKYKGASYDKIQNALSKSKDQEEVEFLKEYTDYSSVEDFDKALANASLSDKERKALAGARSNYAKLNPFDEYKGLMNSTDFAEKSKLGIDALQEAEDEAIMASLQGGKTPSVAKVGMGVPSFSQLTGEMKDVAGYIYNTQGEQAYKDYLKKISLQASKAFKEEYSTDYSELATKNPFNFLAFTAMDMVGTPAMSLGAGIEMLGSAIQGTKYNPYEGLSGGLREVNKAQSEISETIRENTGLLGKPLEIGYNALTTGVTSRLGQRMFGPFYNAIIGTGAFAQEYGDALNSGLSEEKAMEKAVVSGAIETLTEQIGMDWAFKEGKTAIKTIINQFLAEGSEEVVGSLSNLIYDLVRNGSESEFNQNREKYESLGYSKAQAFGMAAKDFALEVGEAFVTAGLSAGAEGGVHSIATAREGSAIDTESFKSAMEDLGEGSKVYGDYKQMLNSEGNLSNWQKGSLYNRALNEVNEDYEQAKRDFVDEAEGGEWESTENAQSEALNRAEKAVQNYNRIANTKNAEAAKASKAVKTGEKNTVKGKEAEIISMKENKDGTFTIKTSEGEFDSKDVTVTPEKALALEYSANIENEEFKEAYVHYYGGEDIADYDTYARFVYEFGKQGTDISDYTQILDTLGVAKVRALYNVGAKQALEEEIRDDTILREVIEKYSETNTPGTFKAGTYVDGKFKENDDFYRNLDKTQKKVFRIVEAFSKLSGINTRLFYNDADFAINGEFARRDGGTIYINLAARPFSDNYEGANQYVISTLSHELTHWLKFKDEGAYRILEEAIVKELTKKGTFEERLSTEREILKKGDYKGKDIDEVALEEVVARGCEDMLNNSDTMQEILSGIDQDGLSKLQAAINRWLDHIKEFFHDLMGGFHSPNYVADDLQDSYAHIRELWTNGMKEAIAKSQKEGRTIKLAQTLSEDTVSQTNKQSNNSSVETIGAADYRFSKKISDQATLKFLNDQLKKGEYTTTYKSMSLDDGKLHSPMAALINGKYENDYELGAWYEAVEHPELAKGNKFDLNKGKGLGTVPARYNPYEHSSNLVINDQFTSAYKRPNLVTVEMRIPNSELTSGYKAEGAKDSVGWTEWKSGEVANELRKKGIERKVLLSRYAMPVRILPDEEVAKQYSELIDGTNIEIPENVVTPSLLNELEKLNVPIKRTLTDDKSNIRKSVRLDSVERIGAADVDTKTGTAVYSVRYTLAERYKELGYKSYAEAVGKTAEKIAKQMGVSKLKAEDWIKAEESLSSIILKDAENQRYLDYSADDRYKAIKTDTDYPQGTIDLSNLCRKREIFTKMFDNLQKENPDVLFTAEDIAKIRQILTEANYEVACALCYVEDRRQHIGEIAKSFTENYKNALKSKNKVIYRTNSSGEKKPLIVTEEQASKYGLKKGKPFKATDTYVPNQYDLTTYQGYKDLTEKHPQIAVAFENFNNSRGQSAARLIEGHAEYKREILNWTKSQVDKANKLGGLRVFSFSDFEAIHLIDIVQVVMDCSTKGVMIQAYTKVPSFANLIKNTNIKLNRSLIPANKGSKNAYAYIDGEAVKINEWADDGIGIVDGKEVLAFDIVEGIDITDENFIDMSGNKNVGNILVGINEKQIRMAMESDFIDYIIPFHTNQAKDILEAKGIHKWDNFKLSQLDKKINGKGKGHGINIYTDVIGKYNIKNKKDFVRAFLNECKNQSYKPRFAEFLNTNSKGEYIYTEGYHKFLVDYKLFDLKGNILKQEAVKPDFDQDLMNKILLADKERSKNMKFSKEVMDKVKSELSLSGKKSVKLDSEGNELFEAQAEFFKDSKVRDKDGNLLVVYHGTDQDFTIFDAKKFGGTNGTAEGFGIYFSDDKEITTKYGDIQLQGYLNITKPAYDSKKTITLPNLIKLVKATSEYEAKKWDEDINDTWISNYEDTYSNSLDFVYRSVARQILELNDNDKDIVQEVMAGMGIRNYDQAYEFYDVLKSVLGFDGFAVKWTHADGTSDVYVAFDSNQFKNASNVSPTENPDIRYSTKMDSEGRKLTKGQADYFKNSKVLDDNGNLKVMYHGSHRAGFTEFRIADDNLSYFFTDKLNVASSYSGVPYVENPDKPLTYEELAQAFAYNTDGELKDNGDGTYTYEEVDGSVTEKFDSLKKAQAYFFDETMTYVAAQNLGSPSNYAVYLNANNPYIIDAKGEKWHSLVPDSYDARYDDVEIIPVAEGKFEADYRIGERYEHKIFTKEALDAKFGEGVAEIAADEYEINGQFYEPTVFVKDGQRIETTTRDVAKYAHDNGYDSVIIDNVEDIGGYGTEGEVLSQVVIVFNSNQIKSIYNENPTEDKDIRYSTKMDSEGKELTPGQQKYFKDSKVRDDQGRLKVMYHGTDKGGFTVFDPSFSDDKISLFFSDDKEVAMTYVEEYPNMFNPYFEKGREIKNVEDAIEGLESRGYKIERVDNGFIETYPSGGVSPIRTEEELIKIARGEINYNDSLMYPVYLNIKNPYIIDAHGLNFNQLLLNEDYEKLEEAKIKLSRFLSAMRLYFNTDIYLDEFADEEQQGHYDEWLNYIIEEAENNGKYFNEMLLENLHQNARDLDKITRNWNANEHLDENGNPQSIADYVINSENPKWKTTRQIAAYAKEHGYDGVIYNNIVDIANGEEYLNASNIAVAFESKQIKSIYNENPTEDNDIRLSTKLPPEAQKLVDALTLENKRLTAENTALKMEKGLEQVKAEKNAIINKITENAQTLSRWLLSNDKNNPVPQAVKEPLGKLLTSISFTRDDYEWRKQHGHMTKAEETLGERMAKISSLLREIEQDKVLDADAYDLSQLDWIPEFTNEFEDIKNAIASVEARQGESFKLSKMTTEDLKSLSNMITALKSAITNMNKCLSAHNKMSVSGVGQEIIGWLDEVGQKEKDNRLLQFLELDNTTPFYFFKRLGSGGEKTFKLLMDGMDKYAFEAKQIEDYAKEAFSGKDVLSWRDEVKTFEVDQVEYNTQNLVKLEKKTIQMTVPQIMSLYCLSKRDQAVKHLKTGGIKIGDFKVDGKETRQIGNTTLTAGDLNKILSSLTDEQRAVADKLQNFMNTVCQKWGNEVTMKRFGFKGMTEKNYFPISVDRNQLSSEARQKGTSLYQLLNMGFTKPINPKAKNPIEIFDIFEVFAIHSTEMAQYNSLALPVLDVIRIWNYKDLEMLDEEESKAVWHSVKASIENALGKKGNQYIGLLLADLNGEVSGGRADDFASKLMKNYKTAAVALNVQVAALQPLSFVRAGYMIDSKYLKKGLTMKSSKEALKWCGMAVWKEMGFYNTAIHRGLEHKIMQDDSKKDKLIEKGLWLAGKADEWTWSKLWNACLLETKDKHPDLEGDDLYKKTADRLTEVIYGTQVVDSVLTRSQIMRDKTFYSKMITAFQSEPTLALNVLMDAGEQFSMEKRAHGAQAALQKHGATVRRAATVYLLSAALESALRAVMGKVRRYDGDEDDEEFLADFFTRFIEELNPLRKIPLVKDIVNILVDSVKVMLHKQPQLYTDTRMDEDIFEMIGKAAIRIGKILEGGEITYKTLYEIFKGLDATGLPASSFLREVKVIWNNTIGRIWTSLAFK